MKASLKEYERFTFKKRNSVITKKNVFSSN
jgi:hypothetical protein